MTSIDVDTLARDKLATYYAESDWFTWDNSSDAYKQGFADGYASPVRSVPNSERILAWLDDGGIAAMVDEINDRVPRYVAADIACDIAALIRKVATP